MTAEDTSPTDLQAVSPDRLVATSPLNRRTRLFAWGARERVPVQAILFTVGVLVAVYLGGHIIAKLKHVLLLLVISGFFALVLNPAVVRLQSFGHLGLRRRGTAVVIVTVIWFLVFAGLVTLFGYPLVNALTHFADNLPKYAGQAEHGKGYIGHLVRKYHVQSKIQQYAPKLASEAKNLASPALTIGKGAISLVLSIFILITLVLLFLLEGTKIRLGVLKMVAPHRAAVLTRVASEVNRSVTGFMVGKFVMALFAGGISLIVLRIENVQFYLLLGLWVGLLDFLPMIGGAIAFIVPTLVLLASKPTDDVVAYMIVYALYWLAENHILNPIIMSRTVRINPLVVMVAVLVGANVGDFVGGLAGGFVGTLLAIPMAGAIQVIARELWNNTEPARPAVVEAPASDTAQPS